MPRLGITEEQVQIAQEALMARGVFPSVDAVRKELGNVGPISTIERHMRALYIKADKGEELDPATAVPVETLNLARLVFSAQLLERISDLRSAVLYQTNHSERVQLKDTELQNKLLKSESDRRELSVSVLALREVLAESRAQVRLLEEEISFARQSIRELEAAKESHLRDLCSLQESLAAVNADNCVLRERLKRACAETRMTRRLLHHQSMLAEQLKRLLTRLEEGPLVQGSE